MRLLISYVGESIISGEMDAAGSAEDWERPHSVQSEGPFMPSVHTLRMHHFIRQRKLRISF
ncbi:hypothetical protein D3H35_24230 [Cohnella faecalis]|uniref:Uncharacterized protein n=1 Tax=Cohnella faecalis TaxID=2315694 RepID=A0A398CE64_9BACL|nr:hypothetical protein D3H35_24230 [Cohnella faecalis]